MLKIHNYINHYFQKFILISESKQSNINSKWLISITALFFIWKLLSRDFSMFANVPYWVLDRPPAFVYNPEQAFYILDLGIMNLITSFHFIHYLMPLPNELGFEIIRSISIFSFILIIFFGRGPYRIFVMSAYISIMYLWGFIFRSGQEIDSMFLPMGIMFCYLFSNFDESNSKNNLLIPTKESSIFIYSCLMVFVIYYFGSGINKLTDIPLNEWFQYDIYSQMEHAVIAQELGADRSVPVFFHWLVSLDLNFIRLLLQAGVPIVYLFHLLSPMIVLKPNYLFYTFLFYALFHFLAFGVGISFTANMIIWIGFINICNIYNKTRPYYGY